MATVKCEFDLELKVELGREMIYLPFDSSSDSAHAPMKVPTWHIGYMTYMPLNFKQVYYWDSIQIPFKTFFFLGCGAFWEPAMATATPSQEEQSLKILFNSRSSMSRMCFSILLLLFFTGVATSQSIVETLPGFPGKLPFKLETGYISVGDVDDVQLFYYFIESERNPRLDPLVLWLTGGPGCSGFSALVYEIGPLAFDVEGYDGILPTLKLNPYSWTKVASIIFIDAPVGTGFSYAETSYGYNVSDTSSAAQTYQFLRKWLTFHPNFAGNPLYIGGDSYSGIVAPILIKDILHGLEVGLQPKMELQGYLLGNPVTDYLIDDNSRIPYAHRVSLISDGLYKAAKETCNGDYGNVDINNTLCVEALQTIKMCLLQINIAMILEPQCAFASPQTTELQWDLRVQENTTMNYLLSLSRIPELQCRSFSYVLSYKWLNDINVQNALYVRPGTVKTWRRCPKSFPSYTENVDSTVAYHENFTKTGLRALIYSGDHDLSTPYIGTLEWIKSLDVPVFDKWRPWYVDGQIAGYTTKFMNDHYRLTYATLKGAGLTAPEYKHKESLALVDRWFAYYPI